MPSAIRIGHHQIGRHVPPTFIAELSGNHNGSLDRALEMVDQAASAGAHVIKLQTYTADTMTIDCSSPDFMVTDDGSLWRGRTLYELYQEAHTPWDWHAPLFERARSHNIPMISTPFDPSAVEFLEELDAPAYKIASFESGDHELLRAVAATRKPVLLSTGVANLADIASSVAVLTEAGASNVVLLKCTSAYPSTPENANLATIPNMRDTFGVEVGVSDHTLGLAVPLAAVALGATVIEKHVTIRRSDGGVDSAFSLEPNEVRALVEESHRTWKAIGEVRYEPTPSELSSTQFRRSLYFVEDLPEGAEVTSSSVRAIRPGYGLPPSQIEHVIGRRTVRAVRRGTPVSRELLSGT